MHRELSEYGETVRREMKVTLSEIKKNPRGTNSEGKETGIQINDFEHKEEIKIHPNRKKKQKLKKQAKWTSGQDGGIDRYTLPPHTTKRRTRTNLKTKNKQNCQKIQPYGSPTTKELKKKHSFRWVGGAETGSQGREDSEQGRS